jgi:hypothetical protein
MLLTSSIDWWWNYLCQHDLVLSKDCFDFRGNVVKDVAYRQLFESNKLPNVYNALTYFRKSQWATEFYKYCELVTNNWSAIKEHCLTACDTEFPNTDEIYALAYKMLDPLDEKFVEYDWFKFTHNKNLINGIRHSVDNQQYLYPMEMNDRLYVGAYRQQGVWHYHNKKTMEEIDARIF